MGRRFVVVAVETGTDQFASGDECTGNAGDEIHVGVDGTREVGDGNAAVERDVVEGAPVKEDVPGCGFGDL